MLNFIIYNIYIHLQTLTYISALVKHRRYVPLRQIAVVIFCDGYDCYVHMLYFDIKYHKLYCIFNIFVVAYGITLMSWVAGKYEIYVHL